MAKTSEKKLTIALNAAKRAGRKWTAKRAIRLVRLDVQKHTRIPLQKIRVSTEVNHAIWQKGSFNIPKRLQLEILKEKDLGMVFLANGNEKKAFLESKKNKEKTKQEAKPASTKEEQDALKEQEEKLQEKRLKEEAAQKAEFK